MIFHFKRRESLKTGKFTYFFSNQQVKILAKVRCDINHILKAFFECSKIVAFVVSILISMVS